MVELDWTAPIEVSYHARVRARERLGWDDEDAIRGEVRTGILEGRISGRRPNWTRGGNRESDHVYESVFTWNAAVTRCWALSPGATIIQVKTLLLENETEARLAAERRLRPGYAST